MAEKHELIAPEWLTKTKEMISVMTPEEKAKSLWAARKIVKQVDPLLVESLLKGTKDHFDFEFGNLDISRGKTTEVEEPETIIDWDKAIKFAKEHNFEIPMTPRRVIEPEVDKSKLESMDWFQNNADQFCTKKMVKKTKKSYDRIIIKEKKVNTNESK